MDSTLVIREVTPTDPGRWDAFVSAHPSGCYGQLTAYREAMVASYRVQARYWMALRGERIVAVLPAFIRPFRERALFSAPGGMLWTEEEAAYALVERMREIVREERLAYAELRDQCEALPGLCTTREHVTFILDLENDADMQCQRFGANLRRRIRKSKRSGFEVRFSRDDHNVADFHRVMLENMRRLGTPIRGEAYFRKVVAAYGERASILVLRLEDVPVASMFLIRCGDMVAEPWTSSSPKALSMAPNEALYWAAIRHAISTGASRFDMGRSQPDSGTYAFKMKWGARAVPLVYQYVLGTRLSPPTLAEQKRQFAFASRAWNRLPLAATAILGERLKRLFPEVM